MSPSEIDQMVYYEYEWILDEINDYNKEQEKKSKEEQKQYDSMKQSMPNLNNMSHTMQKNMPNMSLPKISIPKFN